MKEIIETPECARAMCNHIKCPHVKRYFKRFRAYELLMNIKDKTGHHLLASDGTPLIWKAFPEVPKAFRR